MSPAALAGVLRRPWQRGFSITTDSVKSMFICVSRICVWMVLLRIRMEIIWNFQRCSVASSGALPEWPRNGQNCSLKKKWGQICKPICHPQMLRYEGLLPEHSGYGLGQARAAGLYQRAMASGQQRAQHCLMDPLSPVQRRDRGLGQVTREYTIYERSI